MDMRVLPLQTFSRRTCARHSFRQKIRQHLVPDSFDCIHSHWEMLEDCWMFHVFFTKILSFTNGLLIFAANQCLARNLGNAGYRGNAGIYLFSHLKDRLVS